MNILLNRPMIGACIAWLFLCTSICNAQSWYTVLPGDTFARLARANSLTMEELTEANQSVASPLAPGNQIWIPAAKELLVAANTVVWRGATHEVVAGETWYGIARQYEITDTELKDANGHIVETLDIGDRLQVPTIVPADTTQVVSSEVDSGMEITRGRRLPVLSSDTLRVLAMLPFMLEVDTVMGGEFDAKTTRLREVSLDFFHGMEWASELLQDSGYAVQLRVVDTEPDTLGTYAWSESDLIWSDVILGPLRSSRMDSINRVLSQTLPQTPQWVLTSLKPAFWSHHAASFSLRSDERDGMYKLGSLVARNHPMDTILFLETRGKDVDLETAFKAGYSSIRGSLEGLEFLAANNRFAEGITAKMDTAKLNVVAIPSGKYSQSMYAYVQTELQLADSFPVRVYAHPATAELEFLERDFMTRSNWTIPVSNRIDWSDPQVQQQTLRFREMYGTDPTAYSILAFDALVETAKWMGQDKRAAPVGASPTPIEHGVQWTWDEPAARFVNSNWHMRMFSDGDWARLIND